MPATIDIVLLALGTALFASLARTALTDPRCHGFYRFFVFEATLVLVLLDRPHWFTREPSTLFIVANCLLLASALLALHGFVQLARNGRPDREEIDDKTFGFEHTTVLVHSGAYRFIRHPMYLSMILLGWGVAIKNTSELSLAVALAQTALIVIAAFVEESENIHRFGDAYREYMGRTRRFVPFVV
jgi:protein-S-isoprenylcysteine O-methyltransferase Ste14